MPLSESTRLELARRGPALICFAVGLFLWAGLVVGRVGHEPVPGSFWLSTFLTLAVVGVLTDAAPVEVAGATLAGPLVASLWTAPRGDNDGLWLVIVPMMAVAAGLGATFLLLLRGVMPSARLRKATGPLVERHVVLAAVVALAGTVGAVWLMLERRADPYPELERLAAEFPAPPSLELHQVRRAGDPLCQGTCRASVERTFSTAEPAAEACETVASALDTWSRTRVTESAPVFNPAAGYYERCSWRVEIAGADGHVAVSDDPGGTTVSVLMLDRVGL